jgi:hypothetical protein
MTTSSLCFDSILPSGSRPDVTKTPAGRTGREKQLLLFVIPEGNPRFSPSAKLNPEENHSSKAISIYNHRILKFSFTSGGLKYLEMTLNSSSDVVAK